MLYDEQTPDVQRVLDAILPLMKDVQDGLATSDPTAVSVAFILLQEPGHVKEMVLEFINDTPSLYNALLDFKPTSHSVEDASDI